MFSNPPGLAGKPVSLTSNSPRRRCSELPTTADLRTKPGFRSHPTDHNNNSKRFGKAGWSGGNHFVASPCNGSHGTNNPAQWGLMHFTVENKARIPKQFEGTLAPLRWEKKECWEWMRERFRGGDRHCVYVRAQLWTSETSAEKKTPDQRPKEKLWKQWLAGWFCNLAWLTFRSDSILIRNSHISPSNQFLSPSHSTNIPVHPIFFFFFFFTSDTVRTERVNASTSQANKMYWQ